MRSLTDRARIRLELALRLLATIALVAAMALAALPGVSTPAEQAGSEGLAPALRRWSTIAAPPLVAVQLATTPAGRDRDWLAALAAAGTRVRWSAPGLDGIAVSLEPQADPLGGADLNAAVPSGRAMQLCDTVGLLDSMPRPTAIARLGLAHPRGDFTIRSGAVTARAALIDSLSLGRLLVLGRAGWEFKFTVAALEERGWQVDAAASVAPQSGVRQGMTESIDTSRYAAVIALDSSAAGYGSRIARFVRSGGGLIGWNEALARGELATLAPGRGQALIASDEEPVPDSLPRGALGLRPIGTLDTATVVLERRDQLVAVAARRIAAGRVIQLGYSDLWRWRMAGSDSALRRHRDWLAGLVSQVAYARVSGRAAPPTDVAPLATLLSALGPPEIGSAPMALDLARLIPWLFGLTAGLLLVEWGSRRLRGER